ncbi:DUF6632 domain-containing protein [Methylomicrobium album]|uniref:Uncharacterized protein n=1 Tax=Methylomicrobium album BG8 TaxID=686340 RepID=H8GI02_METAL|nr:DUF6632 domain-containing protein [Methylomicrobium album]EIC28986.1 hypothetical protein Metal_1175 [Methylomicrobium album BG8]
MTPDQKLKSLGIALRIIGTVFIVGIYPLMMWIWPSGWGWEPRQPEYEQMIIGIYATLGVFLILAAKNPLAHRSLIGFTICSSVVHGGIMLFHGIADENERANLAGDVPALFPVAAALRCLPPPERREP